jgi:hypothetical protein
MNNAICSISGCDGLVRCRGWCFKHYQRWLKHGDPLTLLLDRSLSAIERYEAKIDRLTTPDGCHPWTAGCSGGYGVFGAGGRVWHAHRWGYLTLVGVIPEGLCVCHHCDNPLCQNRLHWFLGTLADNNADKVAKGRQARLQGTAHPMAKLTEQDVREIRQFYGHGLVTMYELARMYGVTRPAIGNIIRCKTWSHIV